MQFEKISNKHALNNPEVSPSVKTNVMLKQCVNDTLGNGSVHNKSAKIYIQLETDGEWMFCKIEGCNFWTRKQVRMERHKISHVPGDPRFYRCPDCSVKMCSLPKLLRHDRKFHTGFKDYECKICEAEVTDISVHMRVSNPRK